MDAHAHGHFVFTEREIGMPHLRNDAGGEREADGTGIVLGLLRSSEHLVERAHLGSLGACAFIHKEDTCHTAPRVGIGVGVDIVGAHNGTRFDILHFTHFRSHVKIHDVAGVVAV